jgi:hypothetical protein
MASVIRGSDNFDSGAIPEKVKAWVNFDGTGTVAIRQSYNVSSVTDYGTGDYGLAFTSAMPNTGYAAAGIIKRNTGNINDRGYVYLNPIHTPSASAVRIATNDQGQMLDMNYVTLIVLD